MSEMLAEHTALADEEHQQLRLLVSKWQLLADLAFSDLVLWVPDRDSNVFWAAAQIPSTTGPSALLRRCVNSSVLMLLEYSSTTRNGAGTATSR